MKIHILSNLHLEFGPMEFLKTNADVVVLAGDVDVKLKGLRWIQETIPEKPVLYVFGNHEFYGAVHPKLVDKARNAAKGTNISIMENDEVIIGDTRFLGCTLWTDFELFGDPRIAGYAASQKMTDFKRIRRSPSYSKMRSIDTAVIHKWSIEWLKQRLEAQWNGQTVIVTHHAPSPKSIPEYFREDIVSAAYASNLEDTVMNYEVALWIHGHMHSSVDYFIDKTRVICNPRGYPEEINVKFDPLLIAEIG